MDKKLLAYVIAYIDSKFEKLPESFAQRAPLRGHRGADGEDGKNGLDGKSFSMEEYGEQIRTWVSEASLKFSDLTEEQKQELKGLDGKDGEDGKPFSMADHENSIRRWVREYSLKFSDLTDDDKEELKGRPGDAGKAGKSFIFEDHVEFFQSLKLKFSDLEDHEREQLKLRFDMLTSEEKDSLKLQFSDLTEDERELIRGRRGNRGQRGERGINGQDGKSIRGLPGVMGLPGVSGRDGNNGKDGRSVVGVDTVQTNNGFQLIFHFSDNSSVETDVIALPESVKKIVQTYVAGLGGGTPRSDVYIDGIFVGKPDSLNFIGANVAAQLSVGDPTRADITFTPQDSAKEIASTIEYGETISATKLIYIGNDGKAYLATPNGTYEQSKAVGVALTTGPATTQGRFLLFGKLSDQTFSFPWNQDLYLDEGGDISLDPKLSDNTYMVVIGKSLDVGNVFVNIDRPVLIN